MATSKPLVSIAKSWQYMASETGEPLHNGLHYIDQASLNKNRLQILRWFETLVKDYRFDYLSQNDPKNLWRITLIARAALIVECWENQSNSLYPVPEWLAIVYKISREISDATYQFYLVQPDSAKFTAAEFLSFATNQSLLKVDSGHSASFEIIDDVVSTILDSLREDKLEVKSKSEDKTNSKIFYTAFLLSLVEILIMELSALYDFPSKPDAEDLLPIVLLGKNVNKNRKDDFILTTYRSLVGELEWHKYYFGIEYLRCSKDEREQLLWKSLEFCELALSEALNSTPHVDKIRVWILDNLFGGIDYLPMEDGTDKFFVQDVHFDPAKIKNLHKIIWEMKIKDVCHG
jgi:hypothetical protein